MKKIIQILSVLSLLVVFSCVSAKAQNVEHYTAKIPFNFNIGQKSFEPGDYVVKIAKFPTGAVTLSLEDNENKNLKTILVRRNGDIAKNKPQLIFTRSENQLFLSKMFMTDMGLSILVSIPKKQGQTANKENRDTKAVVAVAMNR